MIERYSLSPLKEIWSEESKYERWLEVEIAAIKAMEDFGEAPEGTSELIRKNAVINVKRILEIESVVDHDVIAFIKCATENMGDEARFFHKGLTSSDIVDTALSLALKRCCEVILIKMYELEAVLKNKAIEYKYTPTIGRTHGVHAEPTSFGLKILSYLSETQRNIRRMKEIIKEVSYAKISGAVGNYANISPEIEKVALDHLGLKPCEVSTQIVPRDIHANMLNAFALTGAGIERIALEIRHLQKPETMEAQEPFKKGQRGSSAMPHKKNPILCERLCGMARMLRSYTVSGFENIALWHERDISHSSVERVFLPDASLTIYYMLTKTTTMIDGLIVNENRMLENFNASFNLVFSQRVLLKLIDSGISRENAYKKVQELAMKSWNEQVDFKGIIKDDAEISKKLSEEEIDELFDPSYFMRNVDKIYSRFGM